MGTQPARSDLGIKIQAFQNSRPAILHFAVSLHSSKLPPGKHGGEDQALCRPPAFAGSFVVAFIDDPPLSFVSLLQNLMITPNPQYQDVNGHIL